MKKLILLFLILFSLGIKSQTDNPMRLINYWNTVDSKKEAKFEKYIESRYGFDQNYSTWKKENRMLYIKEFWYYAESFSVKRNYCEEGLFLDESFIDISRFENQRKENEEVIITLPGFRDVIILMPANQLIYKP